MRQQTDLVIKDDGSVILPVAWLMAHKIRPGDRVTADIDDSAVLIIPKEADENGLDDARQNGAVKL